MKEPKWFDGTEAEKLDFPYNAEEYRASIEEKLGLPSEKEKQFLEAAKAGKAGSRLIKGKKPKRKNWMRNRLCPCGSGKKFKKCCWNAAGAEK